MLAYFVTEMSAASKPRILWIEDDQKYARLLEMELGSRFDFELHTELTHELGARCGADSGFDAILIDMHLSRGRQGPLDFRRIRELGFTGPIFVLSNDETTVSKLEMLALGVDDYLWKVMPTEEIALRLNNRIRRYREARPERQAHLLTLGGLEMSLDRLSATLDSRPLELSKIEFRIFLVLFRHHPQPTPVETLKREAWEGTVVENGTLSTFFWKLNKKTHGWSFRIVRSGDEVALKESSTT